MLWKLLLIGTSVIATCFGTSVAFAQEWWPASPPAISPRTLPYTAPISPEPVGSDFVPIKLWAVVPVPSGSTVGVFATQPNGSIAECAVVSTTPLAYGTSDRSVVTAPVAANCTLGRVEVHYLGDIVASFEGTTALAANASRALDRDWAASTYGWVAGEDSIQRSTTPGGIALPLMIGLALAEIVFLLAHRPQNRKPAEVVT